MTGRGLQNPPNKHHYIPVFYLKRWLNADGKVCEFSRPYNNEVKVRYVHPDGTGYLRRLYALQNFPEDLAHQVEHQFFRPIDSLAATALAILEGSTLETWTIDTRSAWSRFMLSLMLRCPEDIEIFRRQWRGHYLSTSGRLEAKYDELRGAQDPPTFAEYLAQTPVPKLEQGMFETLFTLIDNRRVCVPLRIH